MCLRYNKNSKNIKKMFAALTDIMGGNQHNASLMVAILCDLLQAACEGVESRELRTLTITLNDFFSFKYDFGKDTIVQE